jgi:PAS domain S-box-containing protein
MNDQSKTKHDLIQELVSLRKRIEELSQYESERKQAEEALRESEYKYKSLINNIPDIIFTIDLEGKITFVSKRAKEISGYENAETINRNIFNFIPEEYHQITMENLQKGMKGEKIKHIEMPVIAKSGEKLFFDFSFSRIYKDGAVVGAQGTAVDITERKRAEAALRESEKQYRTFFSTSRDCVFITSIDGRWIDMNDAAVELFGYSSRDELMKVSIPDLYVKKEERTTFINTLIEKCSSKDYPIDMRRKDGGVINTLLTSNLRYDANGKATELMGTIKDITERKKAEEALKNSEVKYRNIFENAIEGIYQSTIEGRFITANNALARMAGYDSPEELIESIKNIGTKLYVHPEDRKRILTIMEKEGFVEGFEVEFQKKDGSIFWVVINARAVKDEQGEIIYNEGLVEDITIRKHAEEQLHQTLDRLSKAVGTTIQVLVSALESRDPYTSGHQSRTANLACVIATEMGLAQEKIEGIRMAGIIHDIGKLSIPAEILSKPSKLTNIEFSLIKVHSQSGYEMLKDVESPWPLAEIVYQHHERMNGSGYPRNLKGDEILMESRILAVADVVEAMASHRPYRPSLGIEAAIEEIEKNKGILYDNAVADACLKLFCEKGYQLN